MVEPKPPLLKSPMTLAEAIRFEAVWALLRHQWDPTDTDGTPDDDYESHARALFGLLTDGGTVEEATTYLGTVETLELGLPERRERNADIAAKAHALVSALRARH